MTLAGGDLPDWQRRVSLTQDVQILVASIVNGFPSATLDVSQFNTLTVNVTPVAVTAGLFVLQWEDGNGDFIMNDTVGMNAPGPVSPPVTFTVPVRASRVVLINFTGSGVNVTVEATTRASSTLLGVGYTDLATPAWANQLFVAGTNNSPTSGGATNTQGFAWLDFTVTGVAVAGELQYQCVDSLGHAISINYADTVEAHTVGGNQRLYRQIILPATSPGIWNFLCRTGGTAAVSAHIASLGH